MANKIQQKDYLGFSRLISIILAIIPLTAWALGVVTRVKEGKYCAAIVRVILGGWVLWVCDLVFMILNGSILRILDI